MILGCRHCLGAIAAALLGLVNVAAAQDDAAATDVAQANNPLLHAKAFNLHDYYIGDLTEMDEDAN